MKIIRYRLLGFPSKEHSFIKTTLDDKRGHAGNNYCFKRCRKPHGPDVIVYLSPRQLISKLYPDDTLHSLSVTDYSSNPIKIHIDNINWNQIPKGFTSCLQTYKQYLIQHEFGHALGILQHAHPTHDKHKCGRCHVMYQQTKGTEGLCIPNPWWDPYKKTAKKKKTKKKKKTSTKKKK